jgi:hypothetical protein
MGYRSERNVAHAKEDRPLPCRRGGPILKCVHVYQVIDVEETDARNDCPGEYQ